MDNAYQVKEEIVQLKACDLQEDSRGVLVDV